MKTIDFPQGSEEWKLARATKVTASRVDAVLSRARDRKSEGATRRKYKAQIVCEILTGRPQENGFTSKAIEEGIENEPFARAAYEVRYGVPVDEVGLVLHEKNERTAASPDGLVGTEGMVQFKCPEPQTHLDYLMAGIVPSEYEPQMQWEMACTGRAWSDFASYCSAFPAPLNLFVVRVPRDEKRIAEITAEINVFLKEADEIVATLKAKMKGA